MVDESCYFLKHTDRLIDLGRSAVIGETIEWLGAEHLLENRAKSNKVKSKISKAVNFQKQFSQSKGINLLGNNPGHQNIEAGLSTIEEKSAHGLIKLQNADVKFKLSIKKEDLPYDEWKPYRSLVINDEKFDFSDGFTDLHTKSYNEILSGKGYGIKDVYPAIQLIENMLDNG